MGCFDDYFYDKKHNPPTHDAPILTINLAPRLFCAGIMYAYRPDAIIDDPWGGIWMTRTQWSAIAKMRNYPAPSYSSTGPTWAAPGSGCGTAADVPHALRAGELVAGLCHMIVGKCRKIVTLPWRGS